MVKKIAVIALVAIIAVPILLGYAMNLEEVTVTDYKESGDSVNVTPLYQNGTGYSYAQADMFNLNTNFSQGYWNSPNRASIVYPQYRTASYNVTTFPAYESKTLNAGDYPSNTRLFSWYDYFYFQSDWDGVNGGYLSITIYDTNSSVIATQAKIHTFYWNALSKTVDVTYYDGQQLVALHWDLTLTNYNIFQLTTVGSYTSTGYMYYSNAGTYSGYIDLSKGYVLKNLNIPDNSAGRDSLLNNNKIKLVLPEYPNNVLLTMDLNSISDSSYDLIFSLNGYGTFDDKYTLRKVTDGSGVHWTLNRGRPYTGLTEVLELYFDSSRSHNVYQIYIDNTGIEFRFVGNWPSVIGPANVYQTFKYDRDFSYYIGGLKNIDFWTTTPLMRVDASEYRAFEYPIIENITYNPADFKTYPATTLSSIVIYGTSLTFGTNTYTVTDGNIMLGSHKIPVKDIVFDSVPNENGNYDNRINGSVVSESADPATITFNGKWSASISTVAQESYTYNKTEWHAGSFGWDGVDQNFLIVGLITCLGVFVALGIYARKSRSGGIIPLMIVTGCAAMVFFIML